MSEVLTRCAPARGLFVILRDGYLYEPPEALIRQPVIAGVSYYLSLRCFRPQQNVIDYSGLDNIVKICNREGKALNIALICGRWTPGWIYRNGAEKFVWEYTTSHVDAGTKLEAAPVPWDDVYLSAVEESAGLIAGRYRREPCFVSVQITGPALENGLEANFNVTIEQAQSMRYTPEKLIRAWQRMFEFYADAFPAQNLSWCIHDMFPEVRTPDIGRQIRDWAAAKYGERLLLMACYLTHESWFERGNPVVDLWCENTTVRRGAQLIDIYSVKHFPPGDAAAALLKAKRLGAGYFELFAEDLIVPEYFDAVNNYQKELQG